MCVSPTISKFLEDQGNVWKEKKSRKLPKEWFKSVWFWDTAWRQCIYYVGVFKNKFYFTGDVQFNLNKNGKYVLF